MIARQGQEFWTPDYWKDYCESNNRYRQYKLERDRWLALELLRPVDGERVLEVGCGYGRISRALLEAARIWLVGADRSESMLRWSREKLEGHFSACHTDAESLPFQDGAFDAVLCTGVLMHLEHQRRVLAEISRVLRPGGRVVVSGNNTLSPYALPVMIWMRLKSRVRQDWKTPWFYFRTLAEVGIEVRRVVGDTFLAVGLVLPGLGISLIPQVLFRLLRGFDRWVDRAPLNHLAYETWFLGTKKA